MKKNGLIRCNAGSCVVNSAWKCCADKINVRARGDGACCATYAPRGNKPEATDVFEYEVGREMTPAEVLVMCDVKECRHNNDKGQCKISPEICAPRVDANRGAACGSFDSK